MNSPQYLQKPVIRPDDHVYGSVRYLPHKGMYEIEAEPAVLELAKRVFPGAKTYNRGPVRFNATRRAVGDLNWLLLRFPMVVEDTDRFEADRALAIEHAARRNTNHRLAPIAHPAGFIGELMPFQQEGVPFLVANERCLLADDMGLGKTVEALAAAAQVGVWPALVVTPPNVQLQWIGMIEEFLQFKAEETLFDAAPRVHRIRGLTPYRLPPASIYLIHYGLLRGWFKTLADIGFQLVVFDEVQELRRTESQKYSGAVEVSKGATYVWGLSGTPVYNYGDEIWSIMNVLDHLCLGDRGSFTTEWCYGYGGHEVIKPDVLGDYLRREGLMLRRRKEEVLDQLPPKRRITVEIDHDEDIYASLVREAASLARKVPTMENQLERGRTVRQIVEQDRQATGAAKAPTAAGFIGGLIEAGERPLIFAHHHVVYNTLLATLAPYGIVEATGRQTPESKRAAVRQFADEENNVQAILLSLRTTAGLDGLQGRGTCVVFVELDWSPAVHAQCEDRLHRIGMDTERESLLCYYLVIRDGSDPEIRDRLGLKTRQIVGIMQDKAETEEDHELAGRAISSHLHNVVERLATRRAA